MLSKVSSRQRSKSRTRSRSSKSDSPNGSVEDEQKNLKNMLLTLIEKADFLVEEDLNALMGVLPDKDKLLLKVDSILGALGVQEEADIEKIFHHLTTNADPSAGAQGSESEMVSSAEKRSKILKVRVRSGKHDSDGTLKVVRGYVEEPEADARSQQKRQALFI